MILIDECQAKLNYFLVKVFNEILRVEEESLKVGKFKNLSVREMHVIEVVCASYDTLAPNRSCDIAQSLSISAGTLTMSVILLEKKGYIIRRKDAKDKRIVRLLPTEKGRSANKLHQQFHKQMVNNVMGALGKEETEILIKGLVSLESFFNKHK